MEERKRCYAYMLYVGAKVESQSIIHVGGKIEKPIAVNMYSTRSEMLEYVNTCGWVYERLTRPPLCWCTKKTTSLMIVGE